MKFIIEFCRRVENLKDQFRYILRCKRMTKITLELFLYFAVMIRYDCIIPIKYFDNVLQCRLNNLLLARTTQLEMAYMAAVILSR